MIEIICHVLLHSFIRLIQVQISFKELKRDLLQVSQHKDCLDDHN
jgi:hypothetical protein